MPSRWQRVRRHPCHPLRRIIAAAQHKERVEGLGGQDHHCNLARLLQASIGTLCGRCISGGSGANNTKVSVAFLALLRALDSTAGRHTATPELQPRAAACSACRNPRLQRCSSAARPPQHWLSWDYAITMHSWWHSTSWHRLPPTVHNNCRGQDKECVEGLAREGRRCNLARLLQASVGTSCGSCTPGEPGIHRSNSFRGSALNP
jgi:hypothetical protein